MGCRIKIPLKSEKQVDPIPWISRCTIWLTFMKHFILYADFMPD